MSENEKANAFERELERELGPLIKKLDEKSEEYDLANKKLEEAIKRLNNVLQKAKSISPIKEIMPEEKGYQIEAPEEKGPTEEKKKEPAPKPPQDLEKKIAEEGTPSDVIDYMAFVGEVYTFALLNYQGIKNNHKDIRINDNKEFLVIGLKDYLIAYNKIEDKVVLDLPGAKIEMSETGLINNILKGGDPRAKIAVYAEISKAFFEKYLDNYLNNDEVKKLRNEASKILNSEKAKEVLAGLHARPGVKYNGNLEETFGRSAEELFLTARAKIRGVQGVEEAYREMSADNEYAKKWVSLLTGVEENE